MTLSTATDISVNFGIIHTDLRGNIIDCDHGFAVLLGIDRFDALGRSVREFAKEQDGNSPQYMISILVRTGEPMSIRRTFAHPDGTLAACIVQLCLLRDATGQPHSVIGVGQLVAGIDLRTSAAR